jgi:putative transposase
MWAAQPLYEAISANGANRQSVYRELFTTAMEIEVIAKIRHCVNSGLILGTEKFRQQVKELMA